jgi:hypothetical protein
MSTQLNKVIWLEAKMPAVVSRGECLPATNV